jgi:hypothetical protein
MDTQGERRHEYFHALGISLRLPTSPCRVCFEWTVVTLPLEAFPVHIYLNTCFFMVNKYFQSVNLKVS